jgi:hypothetical protein
MVLILAEVVYLGICNHTFGDGAAISIEFHLASWKQLVGIGAALHGMGPSSLNEMAIFLVLNEIICEIRHGLVIMERDVVFIYWAETQR